MLSQLKILSADIPAAKKCLLQVPSYFPNYQLCIKYSDSQHKTVNLDEVKKFQKMAPEWWKLNTLHSMNALRVPLIRDGLIHAAKQQKIEKGPKPLHGFHILDVGCGGGFLTEPLARLGASVTGLDPVPDCIEVARHHASQDSEIKEFITYSCGTVEDLVHKGQIYDAVVASEVIEHVENIDTFVNSCVELVKDNGSLFITTINRTVLSYWLAIVAAEYILNIVPKGTHDWNKFVKPSDLQFMLQSLGCRTHLIHGMIYNPFTKSFFWTKNTDIGYALHAIKDSSEKN